ncbi:MAG: hypothetical protein GIX03_00010 [Candidatus Eremiobacteraeota bacterium]|nr:hypothetical protein [Candidatus Eremiobacteraeota bacterium]MBC5801406.1 hypothetical protein [Candidatus Eremiobacteraeota bacterium]
MWKTLRVAGCVAVCLLPVAAAADEAPTYHGPQNAAETAFVRSIQADLNKRFPTARDAERAGYVRYTNEDDTGAISYANGQWQSADIRHPSQLWYDTHGKLLGADFSVLKASNTRPRRWGINPGRWYEFDGHIHYVARNPRTGKLTYDKYVMDPQFVAAGGNLRHPSPETLVTMHKVARANEVATIFNFPSLYDLIVWVRPNPSGAFAEKNPLVKRT